MNKILYIYMFFIAFMLVQNMCFADTTDSTSGFTKEQIEQMAPVIERNMVPIKFYGKVVDQDGNSVEGAEVSIGITKIDLMAYITDQGGTGDHEVKTNKKGLFECSDRGQSLFVRGIKKDGYEFMEEWNKRRGFEYNTLNRFFPDKKNPVVFKLRKRNELAFLMKSDKTLSLHLGEYNEEYYQKNLSRLKRDNIIATLNDSTGLYDEIHREYKFDLQTTYYIDSNYVQQEEKHYDMKVEIDYIQEDSVYEVNIITLDPNSGLILSDELLYEAPEDGYQPQIFLEYDQLTPEQKRVEIQKYL